MNTKPIPHDELMQVAEALVHNDFNRRMRHLNEHFFNGEARRIVISGSRSGSCIYVDGCCAYGPDWQELNPAMSEEAERSVRAFMAEEEGTEDDDVWSYVNDYIVQRQLRNSDVSEFWWPNREDKPVPTLYIEGE